MRISTLTLFETGAASIGHLQSTLAKTQQQISSGRRMLTPADDPVAAARALEVTQSQSINTQYGVNRQRATSALGEVDGVLASVTELIQNVKTTAIAAGGPALGDAERASLATALSASLQQLVGLANSRDAMGNYLFSGFQTDTLPFVQTATGASYQGDLGQLLLQVDATRQMAVGSPGQTVFQGGGQDMFKTLADLVTLLQTPVVTAADQANLSAGLAAANAGFERALDNVSTVRTSVGSHLQELDALDSAGSDRDLQYSQMLSDLQDLDYTKAITQLSQQQITLEAAQQSFVKTSGLSLFNYI